MSTIPEQDFMYLEELIRKVDGYLAPEPEDDLEYLYSKDLRDRLYGKTQNVLLRLKVLVESFQHCYLSVIDTATKIRKLST